MKDGVGGAVEATALGVGAGQGVERRQQVLLVESFLEDAPDDVETGRPIVVGAGAGRFHRARRFAAVTLHTGRVVGRIGVALQPLADRLAELLRERSCLHADETPVRQLDPGSGKTKHAYLWAYRSNAV